jgi:DNA adenine methylase
MTPFLKWPGGKRWFIANHDKLLPKKFNRYIEPFLGSGSVFFYLKPRRAVLGDVSPDLVAAYQGIKDYWVEVEHLLEKHEEWHGEAYYYMVRDTEPRKHTNRAARLIYLNRTCFNGIHRVNRDGKFNVPKGTKDAVLYDTDDFEKVSQLLANAEIRVSDFEALIDEAKRDDLVFADPPYTVRHNNNGFIKYNEKLFSWRDQVRLADVLARARDRGAKIVSTNANNPSIRKLYDDLGFAMKIVSRFSSVSADPKSRKQFEELVILAGLK